MALAILDKYAYQEEVVSMSPGDVIVMFSDGITDATNELDQAFGEERLAEVIRSNSGATSAELVEAVYGAVRQHVGGADQFDDMTLVVIRRSP